MSGVACGDVNSLNKWINKDLNKQGQSFFMAFCGLVLAMMDWKLLTQLLHVFKEES